MQDPENVLELAGITLADLMLISAAGQYVPTLNMAKKSWWKGTRIERLRFANSPQQGLLELAWGEARARAASWDTCAFGFITAHTDNGSVAFVVDAGSSPLADTVRVVQDCRPPSDTFRLIGDPRFYIGGEQPYQPVDSAATDRWMPLLEAGINKIKAAEEFWRGRSAPAPTNP